MQIITITIEKFKLFELQNHALTYHYYYYCYCSTTWIKILLRRSKNHNSHQNFLRNLVAENFFFRNFLLWIIMCFRNFYHCFANSKLYFITKFWRKTYYWDSISSKQRLSFFTFCNEVTDFWMIWVFYLLNNHDIKEETIFVRKFAVSLKWTHIWLGVIRCHQYRIKQFTQF